MKSTAKMLTGMMMAFCGAPKETPLTDRHLIKSVFLNRQIGMMQQNIQATEPQRNSTYTIHTQVSELMPVLEINTLIKPDTKSALKVRINNLLELLKQGITIDTALTALDKTASALRDQLFASMKAYFSKNPAEKSATIDQETFAKTVEEATKEADRSVRSITLLYPEIVRNYNDTRRETPEALNLKTLKDLAAPHAATNNQPAQPRNE